MCLLALGMLLGLAITPVTFSGFKSPRSGFFAKTRRKSNLAIKSPRCAWNLWEVVPKYGEHFGFSDLIKKCAILMKRLDVPQL